LPPKLWYQQNIPTTFGTEVTKTMLIFIKIICHTNYAENFTSKNEGCWCNNLQNEMTTA